MHHFNSHFPGQPGSAVARGGARKKYLRGLAPHQLGGNNEQNYCIQLSSIRQRMYRNYPENLGRGPGQDLGGPVPPGPNLEPPLAVAPLTLSLQSSLS